MMLNKNLVFVVDVDWASMFVRLTESMNTYTDWNTTMIYNRLLPSFDCVLDGMRYKNKVHKIVNIDPKEILENADVIIRETNGVLRNILPHRANINGIWHKGSGYRINHKKWQEKNDNFDFVIAHRDLVGLYPGTETLVQPFDCRCINPKKHASGGVKIGHSPSNRKKKGTEMFLNACNRLKKNHDIEMVLLEGMDYEEVLNAKEDIDIFFDQMSGYDIPNGASMGYGTSLVESAACGSAVLSWSYYPDTPIQCVQSESGIYNTCLKLIENPDILSKLQRETLSWVRKTHDYPVVGKQLETIVDIYYNSIDKEYKKIEKTAHDSGPISQFPDTDVIFVRDMKDFTKPFQLSDRYQEMIENSNSFICVGTNTRAEICMKRFLKRDMPYELFYNYQNYIPSNDEKIDEIVYIDNSSMSYENYPEITDILQRVHDKTGKDVIFVVRDRFGDIVYEVTKDTDVIPATHSVYDYNSKYGILVDAFKNKRYVIGKNYVTGYYRKFWRYLSTGMIPVLLEKTSDMVEFCGNNNINHIIYNTPDDLVINDGMYCNWNKFIYTFEYNFPVLLKKIEGLNES